MEPVRNLLRRTPGLPEEPTTRRAFQLLDVDTVIEGHTWPTETNDRKVSERLNASKKVEVEALDLNKGVGAQLAAWAIAKSKADKGAVIGVVVNTVADVRKCAAALREGGVPDEQVVTLTGSMRGWGREEIVESERYARFEIQRDRNVVFDAPLFLVATPCVEVGAVIDCDHLGVESCAADSLIQRPGRVNRLGASIRDVTVKVEGDKERTDPAWKVFVRVQALVTDGQEVHGSPGTFPARLRDGLEDADRIGHFEARVRPPALTSAVLDDFAMTSKHPNAGARPDAGRWLHGSVEDSSLDVGLARREELDRVTEPEDADRLGATFPVGARETARCPRYEAVELLKSVRERAVEDDSLGARIVLVTPYGETTAFCLRDLPTDEQSGLRAVLHEAAVVLPTSAGGYDGQFVNPASKQPVSDIAKQAQPTSRAQRRWLRIDSGRVTASSTRDGEPPPSPGARLRARPWHRMLPLWSLMPSLALALRATQPGARMPYEVLTIKELPALLRLAEKTVYAMAQAGETPAFKIRGQWRIMRTEWVDAQPRGGEGAGHGE